MRPPTIAAARITRPTPPASRTGRLPAITAASEPRPRTARNAVAHIDRFRRPAGSGRFLIADEICIRELRTEVAKSVARTIRAPIATEIATDPGVMAYWTGTARLSTAPLWTRT